MSSLLTKLQQDLDIAAAATKPWVKILSDTEVEMSEGTAVFLSHVDKTYASRVKALVKAVEALARLAKPESGFGWVELETYTMIVEVIAREALAQIEKELELK